MSTNKKSKNWLKYVFIALILGSLLSIATFGIKSSYSRIYCFPSGSDQQDYFEESEQYIRGWPIKYYLEPVPQDCEIPDTFDADISSHFYPGAFVIDLAFWTLIISGLLFGYKKLRNNK